MNSQFVLPDFAPALPEIILAAAALILVLVGVFAKQRPFSIVCGGAILALFVALVLVVMAPDARVETFGGAFVNDAFARFMKALSLIGSIAALVMSGDYLRRNNIAIFEFPLLVLLATTGMLMVISANNLIALYIGLELFSLSSYVIAALHRDNLRSSEAGLKYFVLGALSSGMLLYGASLIYGFTGSISFPVIAKAVAVEGATGPGIGIIVGMVFMAAGLAFKISAVPFHMWTPDVYEGSPTPVTAFFATAPKMAAMAMAVRVFISAFPAITSQWQQIIVFMSILSMVLGAFAAIGQKNIKRLMAYSSIANIGFALVGLSAGTVEGVNGVIVYMAIYLAMTVGSFACILSMRRDGVNVETIDDLAGSGKTNPMMAFCLAMFMFSMAGIPPLAGFFAKFFVFSAAIKANMLTLAIIGVLSSVVGAYYYLRIVKVMYFDEPKGAFDKMDMGVKGALAVSFVVVFFFALWPSLLLDAAASAAHALF
ncbi:NADH-quinone oxidoreductase subunit NuoN [Microvirga sp. W0021]|uniref:NADH-quinone oxidoreductase subunit N n=1 Tax=Hohaiivirga grylli TaxID=3133970 RepID=A0ABV0BIG7_9HYPH